MLPPPCMAVDAERAREADGPRGSGLPEPFRSAAVLPSRRGLLMQLGPHGGLALRPGRTRHQARHAHCSGPPRHERDGHLCAGSCLPRPRVRVCTLLGCVWSPPCRRAQASGSSHRAGDRHSRQQSSHIPDAGRGIQVLQAQRPRCPRLADGILPLSSRGPPWVCQVDPGQASL